MRLTTKAAWQLIAESFVNEVRLLPRGDLTYDVELGPDSAIGICSRLATLVDTDCISKRQYAAMDKLIMSHVPTERAYIYPTPAWSLGEKTGKDHEARALGCLLIAEMMR